MPYRHHQSQLSALTTWHSQSGLLAISATWGLSYLMPPRYRIPFSEVFPPTVVHSALGHMWIWGLLLLIPALLALSIEQVATRRQTSSPRLWRAVFGSHILLSAIYFMLAVGALVSGLRQVPWEADTSWTCWAALASAVSRPVLWGYIGYLHSTFARLPAPQEDSNDAGDTDAV